MGAIVYLAGPSAAVQKISRPTYHLHQQPWRILCANRNPTARLRRCGESNSSTGDGHFALPLRQGSCICLSNRCRHTKRQEARGKKSTDSMQTIDEFSHARSGRMPPAVLHRRPPPPPAISYMLWFLGVYDVSMRFRRVSWLCKTGGEHIKSRNGKGVVLGLTWANTREWTYPSSPSARRSGRPRPPPTSTPGRA